MHLVAPEGPPGKRQRTFEARIKCIGLHRCFDTFGLTLFEASLPTLQRTSDIRV